MRRLITAAALCALVFVPGVRSEERKDGRVVSVHANGIASLDFSPDGKYLVTGGGDRMVRVRNVADGALVREWKGPTSFTCAVRFSPDGKTVFAAGYESEPGSRVYRFDVGTGKELPALPGHPSGGIRRLAFTPDGKYLVTAGFDGTVRVRDLDTNKETRAINVAGNPVYGFAVSPDGRSVVTAGRDGLRAYDLRTGNRLPRDAMGLHYCVAVAFSPDGKLVASGDGSSVRVWEFASGELVHTLKGYKGEVSQIVFSADGRTLYTGSYDRMFRIWEVRSGRLVRETEAHTGWVWGIALRRDEKVLATCSVDTKAAVWSLDGVVRPASRAEKLTAEQIEEHLKKLASPDAGVAYRSVCALAGDPQSLPSLEKRLTSAKSGSVGSLPTAAEIAAAVIDLDGDRFESREAASKLLGRAGVSALPVLQRTLNETRSVEVKKRVRRLLARIDSTELPAEDLVAVRGVQVLEYQGTHEAKKLLGSFASGKGSMRLTDEASQAVMRLTNRP